MTRLCGTAAPGPDGAPAMRPYDRDRSGFLLGEGAVMLLLERAEAAKARGATPLATIAGLGRAGDDRPRIGWQRPGQPAATDGAVRALRSALGEAGVPPDGLDFIVGSGNGSALDELETLALRAALGAAAEQVPIASILGQSGEWMTSGGVRLAAALYALQEQALPGTAHCQQPDPRAALPGLVLAPRPATVRRVLVPAFAQGGGNAAIVLTQPG
jgi:3-oxoacyl-[acyl-carrier-protein] synthase II